MRNILFIALGGSFGAVARFLISKFVQEINNNIFPFGTLIINLSGCFIIGFLAGLFEKKLVPDNLRSFIIIGFLGAYTTFSSYSMETFNLISDGEIKYALINFLLSNVIVIILTYSGYILSRLVTRMN